MEKGLFALTNLDSYISNMLYNEKKIDKGDFALGYHLMPPVGWLNDPNGLCQFNGTYNIYYQYSPNDVMNGLKGWGLYQTKDFITYEDKGMVVYPDSELDKDGAYSGCAIVHNDLIHYFYTGNVKLEGDYDYVSKGREHNTVKFTSKDGISMSDKECIFKNVDYPSDLTCHVRDPKIQKIDNVFYMVLGARTKENTGCVLVYKSSDLKSFDYVTRFVSDKPFGYMWECPDLIKIENKLFLMTCPQGVNQEGYKYESIYQNGYYCIENDFEDNNVLSDFHEMDVGFDIYAAQTFEDEKGRRIYIGWMGLPDVDYTNPTTINNWQHALTIPRELYIKDSVLHQRPVKELQNLYISKIEELEQLESNIYAIKFSFSKKQDFTITLRTNTMLSFKNNLLTLTMDKSGYGRTTRHIEIDAIEDIEIYSDVSSLEIFINEGYKTITTRVYDHNTNLSIDAKDFQYEGNYMASINIER